jgi:HSP20 family molecular chaperone IbpA
MITDDLPIKVPPNSESFSENNDQPTNRLPVLSDRETGRDADRPRTWLLASQPPLWHPPTDVVEFSDRLAVWVEIAGMRDGTFQVTVRDRRLLISGVRPRPDRMDNAQQYYRVEIGFGEFQVEISLPWPVARDQATATYSDGFLYVELPRARNQQLYVVNVDQEHESPEPPETELSS